MRKNPLVMPILDILKRETNALSEYDIIHSLAEQNYFSIAETTPYQLKIFKQHFLTMNALYSLQEMLFHDGFYLSISPLAIKIETLALSVDADTTALTQDVDAKLKDYYLDWGNYDQTPEAVDALLHSFWTQYSAYNQQEQALNTLGLTSESDWVDIQTCYRRKIRRCHPDKGGSQIEFIEIRQAYEMLKCYFERTVDVAHGTDKV